MQLELDLGGTLVKLRVSGYGRASENRYEAWCRTDLAVYERNRLIYSIDSEETMLPYEVEALRDSIGALLDGSLKENAEIRCMEPDLEFYFFPETDDRNACMDVVITPWNESGGLSDDRLTLTLEREALEKLLRYLMLVTGKENTGDDKACAFTEKRRVNE